MSIWRFAERLPAIDPSARLTLGEGNSPLVRSGRIAGELGLERLYFKIEAANPSGSYKDRFAACAISHVAASGKKTCLATSSGNTGAALAAYCAVAGIPCHIAIVEGAPAGKLRQMLAYGARLFRIRGFGAQPDVTSHVMNGLRNLADELSAGLEISAFMFSPLGMAGVQTIAFELAEQLEDRPQIFSPAGGGGLTLAVARGFEACGRPARIHCVQPAGNDTIASALREGKIAAVAVSSTTRISGLQVGSVLDGNEVVSACRRSGGTGHTVTDESVWRWQARLAREEGIFCEPAGAVALAGVEQALARSEIERNEPVVCLVTGSGFKDEASLERMAGSTPAPLLDDFEAFAAKVRSDATSP